MNTNSASKLVDAFQVIEHAVAAVPLEGLPRLMGDLEYLRAAAELRMKNGTSQPPTPQAAGEARYLDVAEVGKRFHVTPEWLYRHKRQMPHSQPSRKILLFPEQAITEWFGSRKAT